MPIYTFKCKNPKSPYFDKDFDILWSIKEYDEWKKNQSLLVCPVTGSKMIRTFSKDTNFKLKGNGWYETDFKHK